MNITERASKVLAEIESALALAEKATPGPWTWNIEGDTLRPFADLESPSRIVLAPRHDSDYGSELRSMPQDRTFISASRTLLPASLRCLKTAIEGLLLIAFFPHGGRDFSTTGEQACSSLTKVCNQWEPGR